MAVISMAELVRRIRGLAYRVGHAEGRAERAETELERTRQEEERPPPRRDSD